jgi:hypothetical protein
MDPRNPEYPGAFSRDMENPYTVRVPLDLEEKGLRPIASLSANLIRLLRINAGVAGLGVLLFLSQIILHLSGRYIEFSDLLKFGSIILNIFFLLSYLACVGLILLWIFRTHRNAALFQSAEPSITPGWALGWFFVPIANLWMPYRAMRQLWLASTVPNVEASRSMAETRSTGLVALWWFLVVFNGLFAILSVRLGIMLVDSLALYATLQFFFAALDVAIPISLSAIVATVARGQLQRMKGSPGQESMKDQRHPRP